MLNRTTTEIGALDSYQNLLFSLARFHELTGQYPQKVTFVSYAFKERRFVELHRAAIHYPADRFTFVGIDPVFINDEERIQTETGERENAVVLWKKDPYACDVSTVLRAKRVERNLGRRFWSYTLSAGPTVARLLRWCDAGGKFGNDFDGVLPWEQ